VKIVLQDGIKDCGICSLLSIVRFYGGDVSKEYLREITNTTKDGVSALGLIEGATKLGFEAVGVFGEINKINVNNLPCLGHILTNKSYKHFVAIYKIDFDKEKIHIMDPAVGKRILSFTEYKILSTNNYIFLKPLKKIPLIKPRKIIIKEIIKYLKNNKIQSGVFWGLTLLYFILNIIVSFHFKYLIEFSIQYNTTSNILIISFSIMFFYIFKYLIDFVRNILLDKIILMFDSIITMKVLKQIFYLPYLYYKNRTTGEVITKIKDLSNIKMFLSKVFCILFSDFISIIIFGIFLFKLNYILTTWIFIVSFLFVLVIIFRNNKKKRLIKILSNKEENINSYLIESLSNVDTIKGCHLEKLLFDKFYLKYKKLLDSNYKYNLFDNFNFFIRNNFISFLLVIIYSYGVYDVIKGDFNLTDLYLYQTFMNYILSSINRIIDLISDYSNYLVSVKRVEDLFVIKSEKFLNNYYYYAYDLTGNISFKNLTYKVGNKILFNNLNLDILYGDKILLCGDSGCGKSSLMKILMRYLYVPYGMCRIKNIDINHYHLENIRSNITYVSNNEYLFTDTLYNNIVFNREISDDEFRKVIDICEVNFVKDDNYKMMVEENGFNFSNGERQRIILARSLLKKSSIYIFDEAFSQIDIATERKIIRNIFNYLSDKTIIVISHRFYNKKLFSRILKLENGIIYEK